MQPIAYAAVRTPTGRNSTCSRYCEPWSAWIGLLLGTFVCPDGPLRGVLFLLSHRLVPPPRRCGSCETESVEQQYDASMVRNTFMRVLTMRLHTSAFMRIPCMADGAAGRPSCCAPQSTSSSSSRPRASILTGRCRTTSRGWRRLQPCRWHTGRWHSATRNARAVYGGLTPTQTTGTTQCGRSTAPQWVSLSRVARRVASHTARVRKRQRRRGVMCFATAKRLWSAQRRDAAPMCAR